MRKVNHFGIPTSKVQPDEVYNEGWKLHLTDFNKSPNKIEFLRFEPGSCLHELIQNVAHIAYEVDSLEEELKGAHVLLEPVVCSESLTIAFIEEEGIPLELMEFKHS